MVLLSTRAKEAIKTGLAMTIAYGIALQMGWEKPLWAGFAVAMISLSTAGQSLNKGVMRIVGTLVAAPVALAFIALFPQERWLLILALSLYVGFCTYMLTGKRWQYAWFVSAFVCLVIVVNSGTTSESAFHIAVERTQETVMGVVVYALVSVLLWPQSSKGLLEDVSRRLFATQIGLFRAYRNQMAGEGAGKDDRSMRLQEFQLLNQLGQSLSAAETDSYPVWEVRRQWRRFGDDSTLLMEALERWRTSLPEVEELDLTKLLPNLEAVLKEIELRFAKIEGMLAGEVPERMSKAIPMDIDRAQIRALSHFQRAAVAVTKTQLDKIDELSRSLFVCVADIRGYAQEALEPSRESSAGSWLNIDQDRVIAAVRIMATLWIAFFIYVYVDPPGHDAFVQLTVTMALAVAMLGLRAETMLLPFAAGSVFAGVLYILVMPHLSGYTELGLMIFCATFIIYYLFWEPRQGLAKMGAIVPFIVLTFIENEQSYDFAKYANITTEIMLGIVLVAATTYLPISPRPEKMFLRVLRRFFRYAEFLISRMALDRKETSGLMNRWRAVLYENGLLELAPKLAAWAGKIDHRAFPDNTPEQAQALVANLTALALRIKELVEARKHPQADLLVRELHDDVRAWRVLVEEHFRLWADDPEAAVVPGVEMQERLKARLTRLEDRIAETFSLADEGELSLEDYKNFYRLLGSYRGLSESGIGYIRVAEKINWAQWKESRF